jgi:Ribbon-helix-helix domain
MVRTIIRLPEDQAIALDLAARRRGISKAALVGEALDMLLAREHADRAAERALRAAGWGGSGLRDLGERHDEHLAESAKPRRSSTRRHSSPSC